MGNRASNGTAPLTTNGRGTFGPGGTAQPAGSTRGPHPGREIGGHRQAPASCRPLRGGSLPRTQFLLLRFPGRVHGRHGCDDGAGGGPEAGHRDRARPLGGGGERLRARHRSACHEQLGVPAALHIPGADHQACRRLLHPPPHDGVDRLGPDGSPGALRRARRPDGRPHRPRRDLDHPRGQRPGPW